MHKLQAVARTSRVAFAVALSACVLPSNHGRSPMTFGVGPAPASSESPRARYIGRAEIGSIGQERLQEVVLRLRPDWLRWNPSSRAAADKSAWASVYTDGIYSGDLDALRTIPAAVVIDARYLPPLEARNRFGSACHCAGGVILIRTRSDGD